MVAMGVDIPIVLQVPNDIELHGGLGQVVADGERSSGAVAEGDADSMPGNQEASRLGSQRSTGSAAGAAEGKHSVMVLTGA